MKTKNQVIEKQQKYDENAKQYLINHPCGLNMGDCDCLALREQYGIFPEELK